MRLLAEEKARAAGLKPIAGDTGLPRLAKNLAILRGTWMYDVSFYQRLPTRR